jgi:hypothetical protein
LKHVSAGNEYAGINQRVAQRLTDVFMATANNKKEGTVVPGVLSPVRMKLAQAEIQNPELEFERESSRELKIEDGLVSRS